MKRSLFRITAYVQLGIMILVATGCAQTQPYFLRETPDLQYYLDTATAIEYPDVEVDSLPEATGALPPLTIGNHDYKFWDLSLEECVAMALQNSKFLITTSGNAEFRQNVAAQFTSGQAEQFGSIYDTAIQQSTTQSIPLTVDGNGNRLLPRGVLRANQIGGVEDALAEFDAQASGFFSIDNGDRPANIQPGNSLNPQFPKSRNITQQSALSKRFATGGVATWRQQISYSKNNTPVNAIGSRSVVSDWTAALEAQIQHPLMRNRGTFINRIPVVLASLNEDTSLTDFEVQVRNLVRDVEVAYWDLYVAYRAVSTAIIGRNSAIATAQFAKLNLEKGTGTSQELAQSVEQYYRFRGTMEAALAGSNVQGDDRFGVYGRERALRELIGQTATDGRLIRPVDEPNTARVEFDWIDSVAQMLYLSPELRRDRIQIKQSELELKLAKNQVLPDVNLSLLYRWVGVGDTLGPPARRSVQFPEQGSSALGGLTGGDFQESSIRLEYTPTPLGARREQARINGARLRLVRAKAFLREAERLMVSQLSDAVAKVATHFQLVQTNAQRWQAAEKEVAARLAEFKGGQTPVNVVLQSQQRKAEAQIAYYRALTEYNKSLNYVDFLRGTLLPNNNIALREGPWNEKAYWDALERARERSAGRKTKWGVTRPGVVRRGPVRNAQHAIHAFGGQEGDVVLDKEILKESGIHLDPYRQPVEVVEQPLTELQSPAQMMPDSSIGPVEVNPETMQPRAVPESSPTLPAPNQLPNQPGNDSILVPPTQSVQDLPVGSGVRQANHVNDLDVGYAPKPVRRRPIPN